MKNHKLTLIGLAVSVAVWLTTIISGADLFEMAIDTLKRLEKYEIDEIIIPVLLFGIFAFADQLIKLRSQRIEIEKAKIYKAMLSSTHHVLNNFLNNMYLFKLTAEDTPEFPPDVLDLYDPIIHDATSQLQTLSTITRIDEESILSSVAPKSN